LPIVKTWLNAHIGPGFVIDFWNQSAFVFNQLQYSDHFFDLSTMLGPRLRIYNLCL